MDEAIGSLTWRRVVPVLLMLVGIVAGLVYTLLATPTYTARTLVIISTDLARTQARAETLAQGFGKAITTPDVLNAAATTLNIPPQDVARSVQQSVSPESPLVELTATAPSAQGAADIVNAVAKGLVDLVNAQKQPGVTVALLGGQAVPPTAPGSPNLVIDLAVGASAGILLGVLFLVAGGGRSRAARSASAQAAAAPPGPEPAPPSQPFPVVPGRPATPPPPPGEGVTVRVARPKLPQRFRPPPQRRPTPGAAGGVPPAPPPARPPSPRQR